MVRAVTAILLLGLGSLCFAADDSREPQLKYTLQINGQEHEVVLDEPVQIQGTFSDPELVLTASKTRLFTYGDTIFEYPASFSWEAQIEAPDEKTWMLSGNDFEIKYFILPEEVSVSDYAQALAKQLGKGSTRISDKERTLGDHQLKGKLLFVKIAGTVLNVEVYELPAKAGSRLLVFQDSPPGDRAISKEGEKALVMFSKSLRDTMKPDEPEVRDDR